MKKLIVAMGVALTMGLSGPALAHDDLQDQYIEDRYDDGVTHPLRLAYYAVHPIGYAAEWLIGRPFQYIISREHLRNIFGWKAFDEEATYRTLGQI